MKIEWDKNIWTGSYYLNLTDNTRIVRTGHGASTLYKKEFWGDYSLKYPIHGGWHRTLAQAKKSTLKDSNGA